MNLQNILKDIKDLLLLNSEATLDDLYKYKKENKYSEQLLQNVSDKEFLRNRLEEYDKVNSGKIKAVERLRNDIKERKQKLFNKVLFVKIGSVAVALFLLSMLIYSNLEDYKNIAPKEVLGINNSIENSIEKDMTFLLTDKGEMISLNDISSDDTIKVKNIYDVASEVRVKNAIKESKVNTIVVSSKKTFNIILNDGTEVWLNANSKLSYPSNFNDNIRDVKLEGEAFFRVSKSNVPFVVDVSGNTVKVYGTDLAIKARNKKVSVVLISGSVGVTPKGSHEIMLKPSQIGIINTESSNCQILEVDTRRYLAWRDGFFRLDNQPIGELISDVCNWYGIEINNLDSVDVSRLTSLSLNRNMNVEEIIDVIQRILKKNIVNEGGGVYAIE